MNKQYHRGRFRTCQTSKMVRFTGVLNDWKTFINLARHHILDIWQGSKYASTISNIIVTNWLIIYLSLLRQPPKCPSLEGKLVLRTIQNDIYYSPTSIHVCEVQMLAETACTNISIILQQTQFFLFSGLIPWSKESKNYHLISLISI